MCQITACAAIIRIDNNLNLTRLKALTCLCLCQGIALELGGWGAGLVASAVNSCYLVQ